jgi:hypothetical protein
MSETSKTTFFSQLNQFGFRRLILSFDFEIAILVLLGFAADYKYGWNILERGGSSYVIAILAAAATLFSITLAALAILLSFSSAAFMSFLRKNNKTFSLLFLFWLGNGAHLFVVLLAIVYLIINATTHPYIQELFYPIIIATFTYALLNTFYLLAAVIRFGYFMDMFEKLKEKTEGKNQS